MGLQNAKHRENILNNFNVKTVSYKGSKRKLVSHIVELAYEVKANSVFDGFSGTGIVSAALRHAGFTVLANDLNFSSYVYGKVFLEGFDQGLVSEHVENMNKLVPKKGWLTENYSGTVNRKVRGTNSMFDRPLGLIKENAMKLDAARDYIEELSNIEQKNKNALIFSVIKACDGVFNNSNDQKSSFKDWTKKSLKDVSFVPPCLIDGPAGTQYKGDIYSIDIPEVDFIYFDPPYTHGVLYASCYHLNDSIALWDKSNLVSSYAIPRPQRAVFRGKGPGAFYGKKRVEGDFRRLLEKYRAGRVVLSYSDAPRNTISVEELQRICSDFGEVNIRTVDHRICAQNNSMKKRSEKLKEYFIIIDNA